MVRDGKGGGCRMIRTRDRRYRKAKGEGTRWMVVAGVGSKVPVYGNMLGVRWVFIWFNNGH